MSLPADWLPTLATLIAARPELEDVAQGTAVVLAVGAAMPHGWTSEWWLAPHRAQVTASSSTMFPGARTEEPS